jgi:hypothetical protein
VASTFACGRSAPPPADLRVPNTSLPPIDIQYDLAIDDVELAILLAVARPAKPPALAPGAKITDGVLAAVVGDGVRPGSSGSPWHFASRQPGLVFAGYQEGDVSMRVAIRYDDEIVMLRIVESRNLDQTDDVIHADAFTRLGTLDQRIRRTVLAVAQRNVYGTPIPRDR